MSLKDPRQLDGKYKTFSAAAGTADNDVLYTSSDISNYHKHVIENRSAVAIDVFVTTSADLSFHASQPAQAVRLSDDVTTGKAYSITIPANKTGTFKGKFAAIRVDQAAAGTIALGAVVGAHQIL